MCKVVFLNITIKLYDTLICHAYLSNLLIILHYKSTLIVYELCGSVVFYIPSPQGWMLGWPLCSLGAGVRIFYCCQVSEFNYRSGQLCTSNEEFKCPKYKTECLNILLHKRYIELEKWPYFTVKNTRKLFCM